MLEEPHLTDGIGARIAHSTPFTFTKDAMRDQTATFVTSVKEKRTNNSAQSKTNA
jgi:hypothetical protein